MCFFVYDTYLPIKKKKLSLRFICQIPLFQTGKRNTLNIYIYRENWKYFQFYILCLTVLYGTQRIIQCTVTVSLRHEDFRNTQIMWYPYKCDHWTAGWQDTRLVSLLLHRAFRRITLIINQQMHLYKISHETLKIAPTCFDLAMNNVAPWGWSYDRNMSERF